MDMMAERTFAKDRPKFMSAYMKETEKPYGYIILDNHPKTANEKQVIANVFGNCYTYPNITKSIHTVPKITDVQPAVTHKVETPKQLVKRKADSEKPPAKKAKTVSKTQSKSKAKYPIAKMRWESFTEEPFDSDEEQFDSEEEEQFNSDEEPFDSDEEQFDSEEEPRHSTQDELNLIAKQSRNGFGPRYVYD